MSDVLARYGDFLQLFDTFQGYLEFFLLQDLVTESGDAVKFFMPFDDFRTPSVPGSLDEYLAYRGSTLEFLDARNHRIAGIYG